MNKVQEQFERVKRWHTRFEEISSGRNHTRESNYYQDIIYAFFQNCWSLRDWIVNSGSLEKDLVDNFFFSNTDMKICRDLANGSKHLEIKRPSISPNVSISRSVFSLSLGGDNPRIQVAYWIHLEGRIPINAYDLATTLLFTTEAFLRTHKLLEN